MQRFIILSLFSLLVVSRTVQGQCTIDMEDAWPTIPPLLVDRSEKIVLYPVRDEQQRRIIRVSEQQDVVLACPGSKNELEFTRTSFARLECLDGRFHVKGKPVSLKDMGCASKIKSKMIKRGPCGSTGTEFVVSWYIETGLSLPHITLCFDRSRETALYTFHRVQGSAIDAKSSDGRRPTFKTRGQFSIKVHNAYKRKNQMVLAKEVLGTSEWINNRGQLYLARGHLTPDADFVFLSEQDATYLYGNVVPQWQAFNNGNWKAVESSVRELSTKYDARLNVWTGAWGTLDLPDVNNNPSKLFLGHIEGKDVVPVPKLMWKVVHHPEWNEALAIVGLNNPYATKLNPEDRLCDDVCSHIEWLKDLDLNDFKKGYMYCCSVQDLRKSVPDVPDLGKTTLLWY
ncbi:salivary endonuclease-like [Oratosquilla oratoria]|uniref:salivary endonuclease-like n=1 Tax=Oratosquilla oratoria TaxID=337810 RepID=UPI003F7751F6